MTERQIREEIKINLIFQDKLKYMSKQHLGTFRKEITELTEELEVKEKKPLYKSQKEHSDEQTEIMPEEKEQIFKKIIFNQKEMLKNI